MAESSFITPELIGVVVTAILGIAGGKFIQIKTKLSQFSNLVSEIDLALKDDKITADESRKIMSLLKGLLK